MPEVEKQRRKFLLVCAALTILVGALLGGALLGAWVTSRSTAELPPTSSSVEAGFLRDMQTHHAQAVQMSVIVRERSSDPEIRTLALDVELSQQQQIGQMYGWLAQWGLTQTIANSPMLWMRDDEPGGDPHAPDHAMKSADGMPGMATSADLTRLRALRDRDAERLYLQLMIPHHEGGVAMAEYAAKNSAQPLVRNLAQRILEAQSAEVRVLKAMLADRGGPLS